MPTVAPAGRYQANPPRYRTITPSGATGTIARVDVNSLAPLHVSTPTTVPLDRDGIETAVVQLIQHAPVAAWLNPVPLVVVEFHDDLDDEDDVRHVLTLPVDRARVLSAVVRSTARLVDL